MKRQDFELKTEQPRPRTLPVIDADAIPAELRALDQWVVWRYQTRDGKPTKVPYQALAPRKEAETDNPETWSPFCDAMIAIADPKNRLDGIGFVFTSSDPFCGVDLDKCLDARGRIELWAQEILDRLRGYAEISPSGIGIKLFVKGSVPEGKGRKLQKLGRDGIGAIEVYDRGRYFTVTGKVFAHSHAMIADAQAELSALHAIWFPPPEDTPHRTPQTPELMDDRRIFDKAMQARNGHKFTQLWNGRLDGYPSKSEADLALCSLISFYTPDPSAIERMFSSSGLVSDKWINRPDYRRMTIAKALERSTTYDPNRNSQNIAKNTNNCKNYPEDDDPKGEESNFCNSRYSCNDTRDNTAGAREDDRSAWLPPRLEGSEPAAPFPVECLPPPLADLVRVAAESLGCPVDYPALAALAVASGAMGRSVALTVKDGWIEAPSIFCALVGDPGMTKSPAVGMISRPLWKITNENLAAHKRDAEQARRAKDPGAAPEPPKRIVVDDATVEAMAALLQDNPRGLVMVRDELSALFAGLNQYKAGGKGADRQFYLSAWSGSSLSVDRKHSPDRMPVHIAHPFLSIVGGMTPSMLGEMGEAKGRDDGFLDRLLFACPEPVPVRWADGGVPPELASEWEWAVRRLWLQGMTVGIDMKPRPWFVRFTPDALAGYACWYDEHNKEAEGEDFPGYLRGPWAKMRAYCARLALASDRLGRAFDPDGLGDPADVGVDSLSRAIRLTSYFKSHTRRVRSMMAGTYAECPDARVLLGWARRSGRPQFSVADARHNFRKKFPPEGNQLEVALRWLELRHCIRPSANPSKPGPGRPRSAEYEVNPALLGDMCGDD